MSDKVVLYRLVLISIFGVLIAMFFLVPQGGGGQLAQLFSAGKSENLLVTFLDVGQGDAIFISTPSGKQVLIDGGPDGSVLRELPKYMSILDRNIDVVIATHSDKDHIGGLVDVFKRYQVDTIIVTENKSETAVSDAFSVGILAEKAQIVLARTGQEIMLDASTTLRIFSPSTDTSDWESNTSSIIVQVRYGEIEFMLTGDAPLGIEEYLVKTYGDVLESEVLKLGHHGSRTSTSPLFLSTVSPEFAIVSAGRDNRYGHPHKEVVTEVEESGVDILSTALMGNITFETDGVKVWER